MSLGDIVHLLFIKDRKGHPSPPLDLLLVWGLNLKSSVALSDKIRPPRHSIFPLTFMPSFIHSFIHTTRCHRWLREALVTSWREPPQYGPGLTVPCSRSLRIKVPYFLPSLAHTHTVPTSSPEHWIRYTQSDQNMHSPSEALPIHQLSTFLAVFIPLTVLTLFNITPRTVAYSGRQHFGL